MNYKRFSFLFKIGGLLLVLGVLYGWQGGQPIAQHKGAFELQPPAFVLAQGSTTLSPSFLEDEAGISAYTQTSDPINFTHIRPIFRTIEDETADYIIGSVAVPDYPESHDVHVYVNKEGWLLAYYPVNIGTSKIVNWREYNGSLITTKFEKAIKKIANQAQFSVGEFNYYHFNYPNATHMVFILEEQIRIGSDFFEITLPEEFEYYETSWFLGKDDVVNSATIFLDGTAIGSVGYNASDVYGTLTPEQLLPGLLHTVKVEVYTCCPTAYGGLVIIYKEPLQ